MSLYKTLIENIGKLYDAVHASEIDGDIKRISNFIEWQTKHINLLAKEKGKWIVDSEYIPDYLDEKTYTFLSNVVKEIVDRCYYKNEDLYCKQTDISNLDATSIYSILFLNIRCIVWIDFGFNVGNEFGGIHPAVIIKNLGNDMLLVSPISSDDDGRHRKIPTAIILSEKDCHGLKEKNRFSDIRNIRSVSLHRVIPNKTRQYIDKPKYNELIYKIKEYY